MVIELICVGCRIHKFKDACLTGSRMVVIKNGQKIPNRCVVKIQENLIFASLSPFFRCPGLKDACPARIKDGRKLHNYHLITMA